MKHAKAHRLLAQLPDGTLPAPEAARVRLHVLDCVRCRRVLAEHEACERLVSQLPLALLPRIQPRPGENRLRGLASWAQPRPARSQPWQALEGVAAAAVAGFFAGMLAFAGAASWLPAPDPTPTALEQIAFVTAAAGSH